MRIDILTIFPEMFGSVFAHGIIKRAVDSGKIEIGVTDIREYALDAHKTVDDTPYGGGAGMVMKADVLARALDSIEKKDGSLLVVLMSAAGERLDHKKAVEISKFDRIVIVCGRYEGIDERFVELFVDREISVGDYVLSGGEIPAMVLCDTVIRMVDGVLGNSESLENESFSDGLLEYPQYTRPLEFMGEKVPEVLLSGNHKEIKEWRGKQAILRTRQRRPDLFQK